MEENNFYNNPLKIIWKSKKVIMPLYLIVIWTILLLISLIGTIWLDFMDFSSFKAKEYFTLSSTGLTLTLALFVAGKNAFNDSDLEVLATYKGEFGEKEPGYALLEFLAPYVFTSILFLITGLISLFSPFIKNPLDPFTTLILKVIYINMLSLGLFSLFNLVITMLNDVFSAAFRK